jgi:RNA polymerase sigma-70 factor (ECF subfamily)
MWRPTSATLDFMAQHGAGESLDQILRSQRPRIEGMIRKHLGARADVDDLVQTVFLELLRSLPRFRGESRMSTFIGGITMMVIRRARRGTAWDARRESLEEEHEGRAPSPERAAIAREQLRRLEGALDRISAKKRDAFLMWSIGGQSPREIAVETKATLSATRSRIFYAKKELAAAAEKDDYLEELITG